MISVCMATFNGEKYIKVQIESILSQLSFVDELIVSDDGSTDKTLDIIESFHDNRIRVLHHSPVEGSAFKKATFNFENALKYVKGDFIFLADQDDIWHKNKISTMLKCFNDNPSLLCIQSRYKILDNKNILFSSSFRKKRTSILGNIIHLPFRGCCMALKKELLNYILPFPRNIIVHDAWIGIISVLKKGFLIIDDRLIDYRIHANNVSVKKSQNSFFYKIYYRFVILYQAMLRVFHT